MALITEHDDRTLVDRFQGGDDDAFGQIVVRHYPRLLAHAIRRTGDQTLAEDCVQEALIRAYTRLPDFDGDYHLDAWLHTILTNCCHDVGRKAGRDLRLVTKASGVADRWTPAADDTLANDGHQVSDALAALPQGYRDALVLRFVDELSYDELATVAGITEQNARARVSRGRSMLRRMLDGASAAVLWLLPPLRRNHLGTGSSEVATQSVASATPAATQAVPAVANLAPVVTNVAPAVTNVASAAPGVQGMANVIPNLAAPAMSQGAGLLAQATPALAQAAPAVTSSAPVFGKAVVAVGLAASVAIPTAVAVDRHESPPPEAAAVVIDDPTPATDPGAPVTVVEALASDTSTRGGSRIVVERPASETSAPAPATRAEAASPSTSAAPAPADAAPVTTNPAPAPAPAAAPEPVAPASLVADRLSAERAGPRVLVAGNQSLAVADQVHSGSLDGRIRVGDQAEGEVEVEGDVALVFDDGTQVGVRFRGTAVATAIEGNTEYRLTVRFQVQGGEPFGLESSGDLTGRFVVGDGDASLRLDLPRHAADDAGAEGAEGGVEGGSPSSANSSDTADPATNQSPSSTPPSSAPPSSTPPSSAPPAGGSSGSGTAGPGAGA